MAFKAVSCPNCGANYNPAKYQCEYCGSYIFMSNENYTDLSKVKIELPRQPKNDTGKYPGIYVFGRLLGRGEMPITLGAANYCTGLAAAGGKLLLTNKSLSFSAHAFNVGKQEERIELNQITDVKVTANMLISQKIKVTAAGKGYLFVVYHGSEWVEKIKEAVAAYEEESTEPEAPQATASQPQTGDYIEELRQLKQLLDMGVLTEEEFNIKKRMLLNI